MQGEQLTVEVRRGNGVMIKQDEVADTGAGDGFSAVAAHTAESGNEDDFFAQAADAVCTDENFGAGMWGGHRVCPCGAE